MSRETAIKNLNEISSTLLDVHRALLHFQKDQQERIENRRFTPHEFLNLSLNHPNFGWLRKLSSLVATIDENVDEEIDGIEDFEKEVKVQLRDLFGATASDADFVSKVDALAKRDSTFAMHVAKIQKLISN